MRHRKKQIKLSRTKAHRRALFRNLLSALFTHGSIITTEAKAKEVKRRADRLILWAQRGDLHSRRLAAGELFGAEPLKLLFEKWGKELQGRKSGFARVVRLWRRQGDGAPLALVELVRQEKEPAGAESASGR
jgi:large subunit ribosomal protein L17